MAEPLRFVRTVAASTSSEVFEYLRARIIRGEWLPGRRVSENEVAKELGL